MTELVPTDDFSILPVRATRVGRVLGRLDASAELRRRRIEHEADAQATKAEAIAFVAGRAQILQMELSQREANLATLTPMATSALEAIGRASSLALVDTVMDLAHRLRRL